MHGPAVWWIVSIQLIQSWVEVWGEAAGLGLCSLLIKGYIIQTDSESLGGQTQQNHHDFYQAPTLLNSVQSSDDQRENRKLPCFSVAVKCNVNSWSAASCWSLLLITAAIENMTRFLKSHTAKRLTKSFLSDKTVACHLITSGVCVKASWRGGGCCSTWHVSSTHLTKR